MGKLQEVDKGIYLLDVKIGKLHLKKLFQLKQNKKAKGLQATLVSLYYLQSKQ